MNYDVLIATALLEEGFVFQEVCRVEKGPVQKVLTLYPKFEGKTRGVRIGLVRLGAMGSVMSAVAMSQVIEVCRPKVVIMSGIAAGLGGDKRRGAPCRGDVACAQRICYHSFGKLSGKNPYHKIRDLQVLPSEFFSNQMLDDLLGTDDTRVWQRWAKTWCLELTEKFESKFEDYPPQKFYLKHFPAARPRNYGSGEWVISSKKYQEHIRKCYDSLNISAFDMEAFAIGRLCYEEKIPFIAAKGISDFGTTRKNDDYRLAAIAASTAFTFGLIDQFADAILKIKPALPEQNIVQCLHPAGEVPCPYSSRLHGDGEVSYGCLDPRKAASPKNDSWLSRIYEDTIPEAYSSDLSKIVAGAIQRSKSQATFYFPYAPAELIHFFKAHLKNADIDLVADEVLKALAQRKGDSKQQSKTGDLKLAEQISDLCEMARAHYRHFHQIDHVCHDMLKSGKTFEEVAAKISRIVLIKSPYGIPAEQAILSTPVSVLYPCLLGLNVPTFYVEYSVLEQSYPIEDVVFVKSPFYKQGGKPETNSDSVISMRYFYGSRTLIFSGRPCSKSNIPESRRLFTLLDDWLSNKADALDPDMNGKRYKPFPFDQLLKRYLPNSKLAAEQRAVSAMIVPKKRRAM